MRLDGGGSSWSTYMFFIPAMLNICAFSLVLDVPGVGFGQDWRFSKAHIEGAERF